MKKNKIIFAISLGVPNNDNLIIKIVFFLYFPWTRAGVIIYHVTISLRVAHHNSPSNKTYIFIVLSLKLFII